MSPPAGTITVLPAFVRWLAEPSDAHGVYVSVGDGQWESRSYRQLADAAHGLARRIAPSSGAASALAVCSERADEVLVAAGASWLLGAPIQVLPAPHSFASAAEYLALVNRNLELSGTHHILVGRDADALAERIAAALPVDRVPALHSVEDVAPGDPLPVPASPGAVVHQFTSGSMGAPKLIRVSSANLTANLAAMALRFGWRDGVDAWSSWLPLNHDMGLVVGLFGPMARQSDLWASSPQQFLRDPWTWLAPLADGRATPTAGPTFAYGYATSRTATGREASADFSSWRCAVIGAELVSPRVLAAFVGRFGPRGFSAGAFCPAYGMAECTVGASGVVPADAVRVAPIIDPAGWSIGAPAPLGDVEQLDLRAVTDSADDALVSCGPPFAGFEVHIVDEDGDRLPDGHFGEVELWGTSIAQITADTVAGQEPVVASMPLRTGDGGVLLNGELYVVGRLGDGLKVRGRFVECVGLEQRLLRVLRLRPGQAVLALGQLGEDVHAIVAVKRAVVPEELPAHAVALLRAVAGPSAQLSIVPVGSQGLQRTSSGKPQRRRTWEQWMKSRETAPPTSPTSTQRGGRA